jgi:hypothetical protein
VPFVLHGVGVGVRKVWVGVGSNGAPCPSPLDLTGNPHAGQEGC